MSGLGVSGYAEGIQTTKPRVAQRTLGKVKSENSHINPKGVLQHRHINPKHSARRFPFHIFCITAETPLETILVGGALLDWQCTPSKNPHEMG